MDWKSEKYQWPHHEVSQFTEIDGMRWHIQKAGNGPSVLFLHGTGATTHSFRDIFTDFWKDFSVIALDLPGHGFSSRLKGGRPTLERVSQGIAKLLAHENFMPDLIVGHSAGAAIAVELAFKHLHDVKALVSINGAFYPFPGFAGQMFPAAAKLLFVNPFMSHLFAFGAHNQDRVHRLIESTGSKLTKEGLIFYQKALQSSDHVEGTLAMMANWDLDKMANQIKALDIPMLQIIGDQDGTIEPSASLKTEKLLAHGERQVFKGYGHLVHEEIPDEVSASIRRFYASLA